MAPNLSVIIFAQLGVYAYFAAAFVPVLFGTFLDDVRLAPVAAASVENPGISTALGIVAATIVGGAIYLVGRKNSSARELPLDT